MEVYGEVEACQQALCGGSFNSAKFLNVLLVQMLIQTLRSIGIDLHLLAIPYLSYLSRTGWFGLKPKQVLRDQQIFFLLLFFLHSFKIHINHIYFILSPSFGLFDLI